MSGLKLLLIGATVFQRNDAGRLTAKRLVVDYVQGFSDWFNEVIWATSLFEGKAHTQAVIDESKVKPCILKAKARGWWSNYLVLRRLIDRQTVVFLHLPNVWLAPLVLLLRRRAKGFFVYVANDYIQHCEISKQTRGRLYSWLYRLAHEVPIRVADGVIVRGKLNYERASRLNRNVIETVPIGLNTVLHERIREPCSGGSIRILYVGKLVEGKGVEVLLQAFSLLCKRLSDRELSLTIVGTGDKEEELQRMALDLSIDGKVEFLGFVDDKELLSRLYAEADLVVVPSTYPEGVPRVINEALLHRTPVIATKVGGIPAEFSQSEVVLVSPGNFEELAAAMQKIICEDGYRRSLLRSIEERAHRLRQCSAAKQHAMFLLDTVSSSGCSIYANLKRVTRRVSLWPKRHWTPRYIAARIADIVYQVRHPDHPWLTSEANRLLAHLLREADIGLEFGSGRSTIWLAKRIAYLTSVEHDPFWHKRVTCALKEQGISNVRLILAKDEKSYIQVVDEFPDASLDFVLVDGIYRDICAVSVLVKLREGGILVVDDVNRYLPSNSRSPNSRTYSMGPESGLWRTFLNIVKEWRCIWTTNGVKDTAIWIKTRR